MSDYDNLPRVTGLRVVTKPGDAERLALHKLIAFVCTCKKRNQPEWMAMLADRLNEAIAACGSDDRVVWPGSFANEFQFEIGGENLKETGK